MAVPPLGYHARSALLGFVDVANHLVEFVHAIEHRGVGPGVLTLGRHRACSGPRGLAAGETGLGIAGEAVVDGVCLLYTSPSPRD